jgi:hypothetical protein
MHRVVAKKEQQRGISSVAGQARNSTEVARGRTTVDARGAASVASVRGKVACPQAKTKLGKHDHRFME